MNRKNKCVLSPVFVFILVLLRPHLTCACVYVAGVNKSLLRAMFCCVRALECLSGSLKWLDYKVNSTGTEDNNTLFEK